MRNRNKIDSRVSESSIRLRIRRGQLAATERPDPAAAREAREPDELFAIIDDVLEHEGAARVDPDPDPVD